MPIIVRRGGAQPIGIAHVAFDPAVAMAFEVRRGDVVDARIMAGGADQRDQFAADEAGPAGDKESIGHGVSGSRIRRTSCAA